MNEQTSAQPDDFPALPPERDKRGTSVFLSEAALLAPVFVGSPSLAEHLPFVGWLMEALRPRVVVELAAPDPTLFFGACQAADHLNIDTSCHLSISGEPARSPANKAWADHLNERYGHFADLTATDTGSLLKRFEKGTIDLLILHSGSHDAWADQVKALANRLSDRAIVLLHGFREHEAHLLHGFGTPGTIFEHGGGLAVVAMANPAPPLLDHLFRLDGEREHVQALFERLGQGCARTADAVAVSRLNDELRRSSALLEDTREQAGLSAARLVARESEIRDLQDRLEWHREREIARTARLHALEASDAELQGRMRRLDEELRQTSASLSSKRRQLKKATADLLESNDKRRLMKVRLQSLKEEVRRLNILYRKEQRAKRRARDQLDEVLNSRTWRASGPLRRLASWAKGSR